MAVPNDITAGQNQNSPEEFEEFLSIAQETLAALENHLLTAKESENLSNERFKPLLAQIEQIKNKLQGLSLALSDLIASGYRLPEKLLSFFKKDC